MHKTKNNKVAMGSAISLRIVTGKDKAELFSLVVAKRTDGTDTPCYIYVKMTGENAESITKNGDYIDNFYIGNPTGVGAVEIKSLTDGKYSICPEMQQSFEEAFEDVN